MDFGELHSIRVRIPAVGQLKELFSVIQIINDLHFIQLIPCDLVILTEFFRSILRNNIHIIIYCTLLAHKTQPIINGPLINKDKKRIYLA